MRFVKKAAIIGSFPLLFSCALIWLGDLTLLTSPSETEQILSPDEQLSVAFSEEVNQFSFESIFTLTGPSGNEDGDFIWDGASVVFKPALNMQPGFRYRMKINGQLKTSDGKSFSKYVDIPFYYQTDQLPPLLVSVNPANSSLVDTDAEIVIEFSRAMDTDSFDDGFRVNPSTEFSCGWNDDTTIVTITPDDGWVNMKYYSWSISSGVTDTGGVPLPQNEDGSFLVQMDLSPPSVTGFCPAVDNNDGSYTLLEALEPGAMLKGQHLALSFSEAIDFNSLRQKLSFNPSIDGYIAALNPTTALFYIDEDLPPAVEYELTIEEGLSDLSGNLSLDEWSRTFTPDIPAQQIVSVIIEDNASPDTVLGSDDFNNDGYVTIPGLDYYGTDTLYFYVNLSEGIPAEMLNERREFVSGISLSPVFPPGTAAPQLFSSDWVNDNQIRLIYEGLVSFSIGEPVYYRFKISAGSADSANPKGSYLLETLSFIFLAEQD